MAIVDKRGVLEQLGTLQPVVLELGCGPTKRDGSAFGIDRIDYDTVDLVGDAIDVLKAMPDASIDHIYTSHFLEHVSDFFGIVNEIERVLRVGGVLEAVVPHFANPYFASDPTHVQRFGLYTFSYVSDDRVFRRRVPTYQRDLRLQLVDVDLIFKSTRPFHGRHALKRLAGLFLNSCRYMRELHEEFFCYLFPAYEIRYLLTKVPPAPEAAERRSPLTQWE